MPEPILKNCLPESGLTECIVRVYVVRAFSLQPTDPESLADAYIRVINGKKVIGTRDDYVPNTLNPVFGK